MAASESATRVVPIGEQRVALLPSVVRLLLATFLEEVAGAEGTQEGKAAR